jgi:hypothetical protein
MYPSIGLGSQQVQPLDEGERIEAQGRSQFTSFFELGNALVLNIKISLKMTAIFKPSH